MAIVTNIEHEVEVECPHCGKRFHTKVMIPYYDD